MSKQRQDPQGKRANVDDRDIFEKVMDDYGPELIGAGVGAALGVAASRQLGRAMAKKGYNPGGVGSLYGFGGGMTGAFVGRKISGPRREKLKRRK